VAKPRRTTLKKTKMPLKVMVILKMLKKMLKKEVTRLRMSTTLQKLSLPDPKWDNSLKRMRQLWKHKLTLLPSPLFPRATIV